MGMTIDEAENYLIALKHCETCGATNICRSCPDHKRGNSAKCYDAIDVAIETMRKYQKIEELYDYWRSSNCEYTISCMENIGKVLKDGNDN